MAWFRNHYRCARCSRTWTDEWTAMCDDDCPHCGARHMSPYKSEDISAPKDSPHRKETLTMAKDIQQPAYRAYTVIKREGQDDYWLNVGTAFPHKDGDGYNIILQALPIDGKIVLRPPKEDDEKPKEKNNSRQARR